MRTVIMKDGTGKELLQQQRRIEIMSKKAIDLSTEKKVSTVISCVKNLNFLGE